MRALRTLTAVAIGAAISANARGAAAEQKVLSDQIVVRVEALSSQGSAAYRSGDYAAANGYFREAHKLHADPTLLYNIARCHQHLGEVDRSVATYRLFLASKGSDATLKAKARAQLKALQAVKRKPGPPTTTGGSASAGGAEVATRATAAKAAQHSSSDAPRSRSAWVWVTLGTGVALAAGGATMLALGYKDHAEVDDTRTDAAGIRQITQREADELASSGYTKKAAGTVLLASGGAALAAATLWLVLGESTESESAGTEARRRTRLSMGPLDGGLVTSLQGSF